MKLALNLAVATLLCASTSAYTPSSNLGGNNKVNTNRREALSKFASATLATTGFAFLTNGAEAQAMDACPKKANNCVRSTLTPPTDTSKEDAVSALKDAIAAYPQAGQADVDGGGWTYATDELSSSGSARIEFKSSGKGNFAKFFNGGKPFVDDLNLEVDSSGVVQLKSQSRLGDSDFGVNGKRVDYITSKLTEKGWTSETLYRPK